jgi:hypothetical protein
MTSEVDLHPPQPVRLQAKNWAHFPINIPSTEHKKTPIKDAHCAQNKTKEVKHVGSMKSVKCPFISRNVSKNTTKKSIILGEYLHSIHYTEN